MAEELSGVTVVLIIASGVLTLILLFIFVKRQIMRFALRSRRGPHAPIGHDAKKAFRREIDRRIDVIPKIVYEPKLLAPEKEASTRYIIPPKNSTSGGSANSAPAENYLQSSLYHRLKAVDDVKKLEAEISRYDRTLCRHPSEHLRSYLLNMLAGPVSGGSGGSAAGQRLIQQFCDLYEHARYDPNEFGEEEYHVYSRLLMKLLDAARSMKGYNNQMSKKSSPNANAMHRKAAAPKPPTPVQMKNQTQSSTDPEDSIRSPQDGGETAV